MLFLAAYFHTLDGKLLTISGDLAVRFYGLTYVVGFVLAWFVLARLAKRGLIAIPAERVPDVMLAVVLGTLLGGRIGYGLVYDQSLIGLKFFQIWHGGMASHGGMVGIIVACWYSTRWLRTDDLVVTPAAASSGPPKTAGAGTGESSPPSSSRSESPDLAPPGSLDPTSSTLHVVDCMGLVSVFGIFLGRIANFVNGELLGRVIVEPSKTTQVASAPWWSVRFPQELSGWLEPGKLPNPDPQSHTPALAAEQFARLDALVESVRQPGEKWETSLNYVINHAARYREQLEPLLSARHPSQLYQAFAEGIVLGLFVWIVWRVPQKPGVVAAWWLIVYGALRVVTEIWRLPDAQFIGAAARPLGLSRGQWLSVAMVGVGVAVLIWATRRAAPKLGGWAGGRPGRNSTAPVA
ncbi:MAG: prolipoprotein diacylglyceryl transferase [Phycisphaerales bacterium]|nr:prolipoprotein diacylglyceryl transferase [Phycisphaerales bacterium]